MPVHELSGAEDPAAADYVALRESTLRRPGGGEAFIAEGELVIRRAAEAGYQPRSFLLAPRWVEELRDVWEAYDAPVLTAAPGVVESLTGFHVHRGALASFRREERWSVADVVGRASGRSRIAVLEDLVDHTNVGAVFRSAAALGVDGVLISPRCADPLYRRSIKVGMGAVFQVPWARFGDWPSRLGMLREAGYVVAGMTLGEGAITLDELVAAGHDRLALVLGTEGHGLTPGAEAALDVRVTIPMMNGVDSLNVAASSAVAFYATR